MDTNKIIKEIRAIKILLSVILIILLLILLKSELLSLYFQPLKTPSSFTQKQPPLNKTTESFSSIWDTEIVNDAFQRNKLDLVLEMCNNRIKEYPNDAYGYWYRAKALKVLGDHQQALRDLDQAESLAPSWKNKYTDPLRKDILKQELIKRFHGEMPKDKQAVAEKLNEILQEYKQEKVKQ
jgi:tetratricopeptide (TPR) repeat protein